VGGNPLAAASSAADIAVGLPTAQLLRKLYATGHLASIHGRMLLMSQYAFKLLRDKQVMPYYMLREELLGRWLQAVVTMCAKAGALSLQHKPVGGSHSTAQSLQEVLLDLG
jgi:hypothetical protein